MNRHHVLLLLVISLVFIEIKAVSIGGTGGSGFVKAILGDRFFGQVTGGNGGKGGSVSGDPNAIGGTGGSGHAQVSVGRFGMATVTGGQGGAGGDTNTVG